MPRWFLGPFLALLTIACPLAVGWAESSRPTRRGAIDVPRGPRKLGPPYARSGDTNTKALDEAVRKALDAWQVPGAAVAVVRGDEVVYLAGHGVREVGRKDPITPDTVFPLGSCSKAFTSALIASLAAEGKLSWDAPLRKHLPWFHLADPVADREATLRDALCHRTGLAHHDLLWYHAPWGVEEQVRRAGKLPLSKPFRSAFQYQSTMVNAAGLAAAKAGGAPWAELVQKRLLDPLGMKATTLTTTDALKAEDVAAPHQPGPGGPFVRPRCVMDEPEPAGSVHSTARDLASWLSFHLNSGTFKGKVVVPAKALEETHVPQIELSLPPLEKELLPDTREYHYALGWVVHDHRGLKLLVHGGAIDGFRCFLLMVPEKKVGIAVLSNLDQTYMNLALALTLLDRVLGLPARDWHAVGKKALDRAAKAAAEKEKERRAARRADTRPSVEASAYTGDYEHPAYGTAKVRLERGFLVWSWGNFKGILEHWEGDTFTLDIEGVGPAEVIFSVDRDKAVTQMKVTGNLGVEFRKAGKKGR